MASRAEKLRKDIEELRNADAPQGEPEVEVEPLTPKIEEVTNEIPESTDTTESRVEPTVDTSSDPRESDPNYWKHRFDVIQGKYNKEVTDLRGQIAELSAQLTQVVSERVAAPATNAETVEDAIDELASEYGEEFTTAIDKRVARIVDAHLKELRKDFDGVRQTTAQTAQEKFEERLSSKVDNWRTLNTDEDFIGWLGNTEPYSGLTLHQLLINAYQHKDIERVAKIFETYNTLTKPTTTQTQEVAQNTPDMLVEPTKRGSVSQNTVEHNSGKVYTEKQIDQFYTDLRNGKFRGKEDWAEKTRQDMMRAAREGRIVG